MNTLLRAVVRGAAWRALGGLPRWLVLVLGGIAVLMLMLANGADAATYETSCPVDTSTPPVQTDPICERLTALVAAVEALPQEDSEHDYTTLLSAIEANTAGAAGPAEVSGTVALAEGDAARLDLIWIGTFLALGAAVGLWSYRRLMEATGRIT